jgi:serine/threonine protein kinase
MPQRDPFDLVGRVVAEKYAIEEVVAEGGYSIVYRATHLAWARPVAIKAFKLGELPSATRAALSDAFVREGAILEQLSERNAAICQARDVGTIAIGDERVPYLVLEWLEGESLEAWITRERARGRSCVPLDEAVALLRPAIDALALAHREGIVHCDVKPGNFFVVGRPDRPRTTKLLDFGIARVLHAERGAADTTGAYTPGYAAPEQFRAELGPVGPWSDVFALALILVELVTGRDALAGDDLQTLANAACDPHRRPTPRTLGARVSDDAEAVFQRALAVCPADRFANAGQLVIALEGALRASRVPRERAREPSFVPPARPSPARALVDEPSVTETLRPRAGRRVASRVVGAMAIAAAVTLLGFAARSPGAMARLHDQVHAMEGALTTSLAR